MKVITPGEPPKPDTKQWEGLRIECVNCRGVVELEADDDVQIEREPDIAGSTRFVIDCPTPGCNNRAATTKPNHSPCTT